MTISVRVCKTLRIASIIKFNIVVLMLLSLGYFKLINKWGEVFSTYSPKNAIVNLLLIFITVFLCCPYYIKHYSRIMNIEILVVLFCILIGIIRLNGQPGIITAWPYFYILLSIPIYILLVINAWALDRMLKIIMLLTIGSFAFRALVSIINLTNGIIIFSDIVAEGGESWIRNGRLRIAFPSFRLIILPIAAYYYLTKKKQIVALFCIICILLFSVYINQSRSALIFQIVTFFIMLIFQQVSDKKKLIRYCVIFFVGVCVVNTEWFYKLIDSFLISNETTGKSTSLRIAAIVYFSSKFMKTPILGIGLGEYFYGTSYLSDIGILGGIIKLGIPILFFYCLFFGRAIAVYRKANKNGDDRAILVLGMAVQTVLMGINVDCFYRTTAFSIPFFIAIVEYVNYSQMYLKCEIKE